MKPCLLIVCALLLSGCSAQVSGMQSPVLHDYGTIDWIPVTQEIEQALITGTGNSAAVQNDPGTTPEEYQERQEALPADARTGNLKSLRIGLRLPEMNDAAWNTGARLQAGYPNSEPLLDVAVDELPRANDWVEVTNLPRIEPGRVLVLHLIPGTGPDAGRLQMGFTPWRAPLGGWRAESNGEELRGAMVFDTRYERDVDVTGIVNAGVDRFSASGAAFLTVFGFAIAGLIAAMLVIVRFPSRSRANGR